MTWTKVDDGLHSHPKVLRLWHNGSDGARALGLHMLAFSWIGEHLTDGVIPRAFVIEKGAVDLAAMLVAEGLWDEHDEGWKVHDWLKYNPSRTQVLRERREGATRARNSRKRGPK